MINFNTEPYNDDYDENSKFYRILFRPSFAVQARELTQLQTILQNQIQRHGDHIFKNGAMVVPGQISIDTKYSFVKLQSSYNGVAVETFINELEGKTIIGSSGLRAEVIKVQSASGSIDPTTLYVRYTSSGDDNSTKTFANDEIITTDDLVYTFQVESTDSTGYGSAAIIKRGIYYINGHFVLVEDQSIILDKYTNIPSYRVGLNVVETVTTPEDDETLLDNAQNSYNYAAPGAHRYHIDLILTKKVITSTDDENFVELLSVEEGIVKKEVRSTDYSILEQTLARRTYDESGNYTVTPFRIDVREHRNNNRGQWTSNTSYLIGDIVTNAGNIYVARNSGTSVSIAPTHTSGTGYDGTGSTGIQWEYNESPEYNRGIYLNGDESKLAIGMEPGKAYVRGYEIEKIATEYVAVDKARDYVQADNAIIPATIGNYVLVNNLNNLPKVDTFETVTLYDRITNASGRGTAVGTAVGTARVRAIEWHNGTIGSTSATWKLFLFDVKLNTGVDFNRDVKSFYWSNGTAAKSFTADLEPILTQLIGSVTTSSGTVTGTGTSFQTDLSVGDYISIAGTLCRVTDIASQSSLTIDNTTIAVTGSAFSLVYTEIKEPNSTSLLFQFPYYAIRSMRSALGTNDTTYTVYERLTGTATSGGSPSLTVTTPSGGTMASAAETDNYILVDDTTGSVVLPNSITPTGSSVTFSLSSTYAGRAFIVIAAVNKTGSSSTEKTKTLTVASPAVYSTQETATAPVLFLPRADVYKIVSIKMKTGTFASPGSTYSIDISDRYLFDDGQRDTHYDLGRLILKGSSPAPTAPVQVEYEYFSHSTGDYFSVNSYPSNVDYKKIPYYGNLSLRDCIDFRPRVDDSGSGFSGSGASVTEMPKRGIDIRADFTYYLPRKDKIAIDFNGSFFNIQGVSSLNPGEPIDPALGMVLYKLTLEPYTFGASSTSVYVDTIDNKRYTMRDIGKLEKRIDNLEYYTSLSLLEQETNSLNITDDVGLSRFKNGFIVDNFSGHGVGDITSEDYNCAIDMERGELRPFFSMKNVNMLEKNSNNTQRTSSNYKLYGDVITLPVLDHIKIVEQQYASRTEFVNPFAVFTFLGDVKLNPSSDDWFETERRPDIVNNLEGNFNTVAALAEKAGVLGTVWNSWQTQWTGVPVTRQISFEQTGFNQAGLNQQIRNAGINLSVGNIFNQGNAGLGVGGRRVTVETVATQIGQSRSGVKTNVVAKIDRQTVDDRVVSTAVIPYIRSRNVLVQVKGLKPETRFYPFFDDVDVSEFCTPASKIVYTTSGATLFDSTTNVGGTASEVARRISGDSQVCLNRGDVITGVTSGAKAVVVGSEIDPDNNSKAVFVVNISGTFANGETINGSISGTTGTVVSTTVKTTGSSIITNKTGEIQLLFNIPNTDSIRFRTGSREFKLIDNTVSSGEFTSRGRAQYRAEGVLETRQATVNAVRNAELVQEAVQDSRTIVESSERVVGDTGWYDPLAQTFLVDQKGGAFLSKVDIFFSKKDERIPVTLEIREVVNGYPGKRVLPFSRVTLDPSKVNISTNNVSLFGVDTPSYDTATTFEFPSPVYVQDNNEYCVVLLSDSNQYKVWISQMGDVIPNSTRTISEQPYMGVLFKSQNASTWTADQYQDLKFTLYRAKFDTSVVGNVEFVNDVIPTVLLETNPIQTKTGTNVVRIWQNNHGLTDSSKVIISGVASAVNGIPSAELNTTHTISNVDLDSYTITVSTNATSTGFAGGAAVKATQNIQYDVIQPIIQTQNFSDTRVEFSLKTTSGKSVDGSQSPYVIDTGFGSCLSNENNYFFTPRVIASEVNESNLMGGLKSLTLSCQLSTTNDSLSPVIDTHRTSSIVISNRINNPSETNVNVSQLDLTTLFTGATGAFSFSGSTITSTNSTIRGLMKTVSVGKYITISGATTTGNNGTFLVTEVSDNGSAGTVTVSGVTFTSESAVSGTAFITKDLFVHCAAPLGSTCESKYISKKIKLVNSSTFLKVRFAANIPSESDVELYYKTNAAVGNNSNSFDNLMWTLATPIGGIVKVENGNETFYDVDYSIENLAPFDTVMVKLNMKSTNSSAIPKIKDLRIIACA